LAGHTLSLPFNDLEAFEKTMNRWGPEMAAVIVEPVPGNMGVVVPDQAFLLGLREITQRHGTLLIFDEVISGFRVRSGGAQALYGVMPDLTCLGKIIGGGLPVGAYGGKRSIMARMAPEGEIYQAGTLSGNPLAMAAGLATLKALQQEGVYEALEEKSEKLFSGLQEAGRQAGFDTVVNRVGSMGSLFFSKEPVGDFSSVKRSDAQRFADFYSGMLEQGIYLAPSAFETWFVSTAHDEESIEKTIDCAAKSLNSLRRKG
jgi:glutamate-1-semialdehyde 2,1-aminomutase